MTCGFVSDQILVLSGLNDEGFSGCWAQNDQTNFPHLRAHWAHWHRFYSILVCTWPNLLRQGAKSQPAENPMGFGLRREFCFSVQSEDRRCVMCSSDQTTYQGYNVYVYSIHLLVRSCVEVPLECCISYLCPFRLALWPATTASCSIELAGVKRYAKQLQREATSFGKGLYIETCMLHLKHIESTNRKSKHIIDFGNYTL